MDIKGVRLLEAIGQEGLRRAIADTFDRAALVHLANVCRLRFPGSRAQSMPVTRLLDELIAGFLKDAPARAAIMKALIRANAEMREQLSSMTPADLALAIAKLPEDRIGRALFVLADEENAASLAAARPLLDRLGAAQRPAGGDPAGPGGDGGRRSRFLEEEVAVLRGRAARLERDRGTLTGQIEEARGRESALHEDLVATRKEIHHLRRELAHVAGERDRLAGENASLLAGRGAQSAVAPQVLEDLSVRLSQLSRETKKIGHVVETLARPAPGGNDAIRPYLDALAASVESLRRDLAELRGAHEEQGRRLARGLQDLAADAHAIRSDMAHSRKLASENAPRRRGEPERVGLFVDVQNMYYAARQLNARLDFGALMSAVTRDRRLIRAIAYVVQNRDIDQSGFLAMLQQRNYEVRRKDLKIRHDGSSKGDWDMEMALDILGMAENLDVVVLASGDGDFASLVTQIKTLGPKVEVYSFPGSTARELVDAADRHIQVDEGFLIRLSPSV